jgi:hypothetical protein
VGELEGFLGRIGFELIMKCKSFGWAASLGKVLDTVTLGIRHRDPLVGWSKNRGNILRTHAAMGDPASAGCGGVSFPSHGTV